MVVVAGRGCARRHACDCHDHGPVVVPAGHDRAVIVAAVVLTLRRGLQKLQTFSSVPEFQSIPTSGVFDAELLLKHRFDAPDHGACFLVVGANVQRGHRCARGELPHVNVADGRQFGTGAHQAFVRFSGEDPPARLPAGMWDRLGEKLPCATQDQRRDQDRQDGIGSASSP